MWGGLTEQQRRRLAAGSPEGARRPEPRRRSGRGWAVDLPGADSAPRPRSTLSPRCASASWAAARTSLVRGARRRGPVDDDRPLRPRDRLATDGPPGAGSIARPRAARRVRARPGPEYDGVMDLAKAAIERMELDVGLDVDIESEAPPGSGLGGSSALDRRRRGPGVLATTGPSPARRSPGSRTRSSARISTSPVAGRITTPRRSRAAT